MNLTLTMLLGGLWHGASWTFVTWGLLHGVGLAVHKMIRERRPGTRTSGMPVIVGWALTNVFVALCWVLFRAKDFPTALIVYGKLFGLLPGGISWFYLPLYLLLALVIMAHAIGWLAANRARLGPMARKVAPPRLLAVFYAQERSRRLRPFALRPHPNAGLYVLLPPAGFMSAFGLTVWILLVLIFGATNTNPFIYFQF